MNLVLMGGLVSALSYHCGLHGRLGVTRQTLALPPGKRLPRPLKIAFASDFHAGPPTHAGIFRDLFAAVAAEQPDVLLLGGDYVSGPAANAAAMCPPLAACQPPLGKFAVLGNHDLSTDDADICRRLEAAGVQMLVNRAVTLPAPFDQVSICGLDDPWTGHPNAAAAFAGAAAVRVLLMHAPDGLLTVADRQYDIAFAGHTHGGQIALRDGTPLVLPEGPLSRPYHYGRFPVHGNGELIVSRGVGCSRIPVRINADPELVLCTVQ
ncbi:metallophosphoesterase [Janthinobacterium sp. HH01]|uniref:metallophosphoesterase n=1 Tax=Janthinobacterium sp. HH01 TaxID=1198452 RepID=UPI0002AEC3F8|nr:metallophosphoesterase [Janthinobacterium sp. HH01]ELX10059.1 metallophosphoesterase [Janthinobacterium sp. HH01]